MERFEEKLEYINKFFDETPEHILKKLAEEVNSLDIEDNISIEEYCSQFEMVSEPDIKSFISSELIFEDSLPLKSFHESSFDSYTDYLTDNYTSLNNVYLEKERNNIESDFFPDNDNHKNAA
ncbi:MAG: hypothetical protein ACQESN_10960 [Thermotogota bacterium]